MMPLKGGEFNLIRKLDEPPDIQKAGLKSEQVAETAALRR